MDFRNSCPGRVHRRFGFCSMVRVTQPKPKQPPAPGYCWVRVKGGPRDGEWLQVLRREYQQNDNR